MSIATLPKHPYFRGDIEGQKPVCVFGTHGLIGGALAARFGSVTHYPTRETRIVFDFASYWHVQFEENPAWHIKQQLDRMTQLLAREDIIYVYPSSALTYEKDTEFSRFKKAVELLVSCHRVRSIGLRIFPTYGPQETRTAISKFCRDMQAGKSPVVYGNGEQARDFIFVDDVVDQVIALIEENRWGHRVVDIGTGTLTRFNDIIGMINTALGTSIEPTYIRAPFEYSEGIACKHPMPVKVTVEQGIETILSSA